jgi:SNF2 family DNA or RNA helicase
MIRKSVVDVFLNRKLENYDWIKSVGREELEEAVKELGYKSNLKLVPHTHQLAVFYLCATTDNFLLHLDMGLGKTVIALMIFDYLKQQKKIDKLLVVVPGVINIQNWKEQIEQFSDYKIVKLYGSLKERQELLNEEAGVYVINYEGLSVMTTNLQKTRNKKKRSKVFDPIKAKDFINSFDMVVLDETHRAKNHRSLTFEICNYICERTPYRYSLTGTPLGKDSQDLWSQMYLIDRGETLGTSISMFRQAFYNAKPGYFGGVDFVLDKRKEQLLHSFIKNKSIYYSDKECGDLPKQVFIKRFVPFSDQSHSEMQTLRTLARETIEDKKTTVNFYNKGRQISSGFVYEVFEDGSRIAIRFKDNPKLDELSEIIEELPEDQKAIIFFHFQESGIMIKERLVKMNLKFNGGEKDLAKEYENFRKDKTSKIFLINISSGSTGLNLQNAAYCIYYEITDNVITYRQSLKRIHREGQLSDRVFYYFLLTKNSIEEKILSSLEEGIDLSSRLIEGKISIKDLL